MHKKMVLIIFFSFCLICDAGDGFILKWEHISNNDSDIAYLNEVVCFAVSFIHKVELVFIDSLVNICIWKNNKKSLDKLLKHVAASDWFWTILRDLSLQKWNWSISIAPNR